MMRSTTWNSFGRVDPAGIPEGAVTPLRAAALSLVLGLLLPSACQAASGKIVAVHDGDTLTILQDRTQVRVRLAHIDAPELGQDFGVRSKQSLAEICFDKSAELKEQGRDRYGRVLARVNCTGTDASAEQVRRGMAWVYVKYAPSDSPLYRLEAEARADKRGTWDMPTPIPPWEWRLKVRQE